MKCRTAVVTAVSTENRSQLLSCVLYACCSALVRVVSVGHVIGYRLCRGLFLQLSLHAGPTQYDSDVDACRCLVQ